MHLLRVKAQIQFKETQGHFCILRSKTLVSKKLPKKLCLNVTKRLQWDYSISQRQRFELFLIFLHLTEDCCILWIIQPKVRKVNDIEVENKFLVVVLSRILLVMMMMQPILWLPYIFGWSAPYSILHTIEVLSFHKWKNC